MSVFHTTLLAHLDGRVVRRHGDRLHAVLDWPNVRHHGGELARAISCVLTCVLVQCKKVGLHVASDRGGIAEIDPRIQCFPSGDLDALRELLRSHSAQGRGRWKPRDFSMSAHVQALEKVYRKARVAWLR